MSQQRQQKQNVQNNRQNYHKQTNKTGSSNNNSIRRISLSSTFNSSNSRTYSRNNRSNSRSKYSIRNTHKPLKKVQNRIKTPKQEQYELNLNNLPPNNETISEESDKSIYNTSYLNNDQSNSINQIPHNTQVLTSSLINQVHPQPTSEHIQITKNITKSSIQLGELIKGKPQSPRFTKPHKPETPNQFQIYKQLRDGHNQSNIAPSSEGVETIANSAEYKSAINQTQQNGLYDLNIIMKTKAYRNDDLQRMISNQNPQLLLGQKEWKLIFLGSKPIQIFYLYMMVNQ
ncbi:hypothetical protein ABPG72_019933 [Tetrahymena utriculariae]